MPTPKSRGRQTRSSAGTKKSSQATRQATLDSLTRLASGTLLPPIEEDSASEVDYFSEALETAINKITSELRKLKQDFSRAIGEHKRIIDALKAENEALKGKCVLLDSKISGLEKSRDEHRDLINRQERFSRRSNLRIVGVPQQENEDCIKVAQDVFDKVGIASCKIERAHRDGRVVRGRSRHMLVKLSFYQDKVAILKNARRALAAENFYIIDDLTKADLLEKRKWSQKVTELFNSGTRLHFSGGCWRSSDGKPFDFSRN